MAPLRDPLLEPSSHECSPFPCTPLHYIPHDLRFATSLDSPCYLLSFPSSIPGSSFLSCSVSTTRVLGYDVAPMSTHIHAPPPPSGVRRLCLSVFLRRTPLHPSPTTLHSQVLTRVNSQGSRSSQTNSAVRLLAALNKLYQTPSRSATVARLLKFCLDIIDLSFFHFQEKGRTTREEVSSASAKLNAVTPAASNNKECCIVAF